MSEEMKYIEAQVSNVTLTVKLEKSSLKNIKRSIRHALDSTSHSQERGTIVHVDSDYNTHVIMRESCAEVIVTHMDCTIAMSKDTSDHNIFSVCGWALNASADVEAVSMMEFDGYEIKTQI